MNPSRDKLAEILRKVLDLPAVAPVEGLSRKTCPEWDSLRHVKLCVALQREFAIRLTAQEVLQLCTFEELCALVKAKS